MKVLSPVKLERLFSHWDLEVQAFGRKQQAKDLIESIKLKRSVLFVSQGFYWFKIRGSAGRINPEKQANRS
jgi:hypothetical protein